MKIIVLRHTAWIEMLIHSWQQLNSLEVRDLPLPVTEWDGMAELKSKIKKLIVDLAEIEKPAFILDVNGAGILPLEDGSGRWTPEAVDVPWVEWWWDEPSLYYPQYKEANEIEDWFRALKAPSVRHFMWDATLAREYSRWLGKDFKYLPTATHPGAFNPAAEAHSDRKFPSSDIAFLGTFFQRPHIPEKGEEAKEINFVLEKRVENPDENYFDITGTFPERTPLLSSIITEASKKPLGIFTEEPQAYRRRMNGFTGFKRRTEKLEELNGFFDSKFFCGDNWPDEFGASKDKIYQPLHLVSLYRSALFSLDLGNGQSFSGTTMRCYEIMSSGGVLAISNFPDFDPEGKLNGTAYIKYSSAEELCEKKEFFRNHPENAAAIRNNAREYVLSAHTWPHRLSGILQALT